jgi:hypothetical protein
MSPAQISTSGAVPGVVEAGAADVVDSGGVEVVTTGSPGGCVGGVVEVSVLLEQADRRSRRANPMSTCSAGALRMSYLDCETSHERYRVIWVP